MNSLRPLEIAPGIVVSLGTDTGDTVAAAFGLVVLHAVQDGGLRYVAPLGEEASAPMGG